MVHPAAVIAHHFDVLKPCEHQRLQQLTADASSTDSKQLGTFDLLQGQTAGGSVIECTSGIQV